jgi:FkbM family methyltransferase
MHQSAYNHIKACVETYMDASKSYRVLDFGARMSRKQHLIHRDLFRQFKGEYIGMDVLAGDNVDVVMPKPYTVPFDNESMDVVVSGQVFEHVPFFWVSFLEMARVLKVGGHIFLTAPSRGHTHSHPFDCWRFYPDGYKALAAFAQLKLVHVHTDFPPRAENGRFAYHRAPSSEYWGDTVGVFQKTELHREPELQKMRVPLQEWANKVADVNNVLSELGSLPSKQHDDKIRHTKFDIVFPDSQLLSDKVLSKLKTGRYELREATAVLKYMKPKQRVLELGGGIGFMSTLIKKNLDPISYTVVEADPRLIPVIRETHRLNNIEGVLVHNCIATSDPVALSKGYSDLQIASTFWGSSVKGGSGSKSTRVDAVALKTFLDSLAPDALIIDIEGAEVDLFDGIDMPSVNLVVAELHPTVIGEDGIKKIENEMNRAGLSLKEYDDNPRVAVAVYAR